MTNLLHEGQAYWEAFGHHAGHPTLMTGTIHFAQKV